LVGLGSRSGDDRIAATILAALVIALTSWPVIAAMRTERAHRAELQSLDDPDVLMSCLSFDMGSRIAARLQSFGGHRARWAAPFVTAAVALVASLVALALLQRALGVNFGALIGQASGLVAMWVLYRSMRHAKPRASELRERDRRPPVLILREFQDDALMTQGFSFGRSFEHYFAQELDRVGPTISVGRPGEALAPLGAARDYLADPDWKRRVADLIQAAAVVVFLLGDSESLLWEFRTTVAMRGKQRMLMIVPPLRDRAELGRRWTRFVGATTDVIGPELPRELPDEPVLAFFFAGDDAVLMAGEERTRSRKLFPKAPLDYRLALRLFECLLRDDPRSARAVEGFMLRKLPVVASSALVP
jgi:hypothetical protein